MIPYIHRDISWLAFNYRVLQEAKDPAVPLFERLKFLAIYSSNLDEFFRVRVANHRSLLRTGKKTRTSLDFEPAEILDKILSIVNAQQEEFSHIFEKQIIPELAKSGINILRRKKLNEEQKTFIEDYFKDNMLPFVQPVLLVGNKIKPFLNTGALYLAMHLQDTSKLDADPEYAIVKIPSDHLPRFIELSPRIEGEHDVILIDEIVRHNVRNLFPGYEIVDTYSIKLTRDAELYIDDEYSGDLISKIKKSLNKRNVGVASRMVHDRFVPSEMMDYLSKVFELSQYDKLPEGRYHNNADFFGFPKYGMTHHMDGAQPPLAVDYLMHGDSIFDIIREKDQFLHVPYQSYDPVLRFFEDAADDPDVTHIKIIQYRVAKKSRIMDALRKAVKNGKQVTAFVEIKARFDEAANLLWAERLEEAGVTVHYSMPGVKVHSKLALVRKIEEDKARLYAYVSTGNFHEDTAKIYSDLGIFTADKRITSEAARLFTYLETKTKPKKNFEYLGVGQFNLKPLLIKLIKKEIANAEAGKKARIVLKMNSIHDEEMISLLYEASQKGVQVQMIIRGICSLVPGVKGVSDKIEAISIVDRYLEHARIFWFHNKGDEKVYISSADWMVRNLHRRIETMVPILDEDIKNTVKELMNIQLYDNVKARYIHKTRNNEYRTETTDLAVRSQVETYYYMKRYNDQQMALLEEEN